MKYKVLFVCTALALAACASNRSSHGGNDDRGNGSTGHHGGGSFGAGQIVTVTGAASDAVDAVALLDGPGRGGAVGHVGNGRLLTVDNCDGGWCHVRTTTGQSQAGWIEERHLQAR